MSTSNRFNVLLLKDSFNNVFKNTKNTTKNYTASETSRHNSITSTNNAKNRFVSKEINQERNKKIQNEQFIKSLESSEDFPELQNITHKNINNDNTDGNNMDNRDNNEKTNFLDIIKMNNNIKHDDTNNEDNIIPPGCVCIQYDKDSKKLVWTYGDEIKKVNDAISIEDECQEQPFTVMERVSKLYRNRRNDYINKWGIEEYDKTFMFQNYDYDYFDKLDEKMERVIKKNSYYYTNNVNNTNNTYTD